MLTNYYLIRGAMKVLDDIEQGKLRVDRTLDFSVSDAEKRHHIECRMNPNLQTLRKLTDEMPAKFRIAMDRNACRASQVFSPRL